MLRMVLSSLFFAVMAAFAKVAGARLPAQEIVFARSVISSSITLALMARARVPVFGTRPALLASRGFSGFVSLSCYFWTLLHLPFAEAVLLAQVNPIFAALFAQRFLGEPVGRRFVPAAALVFTGVLLVVPPEFGALEANLWALVGLTGAVLAGSAYAHVRALSRTEHPLRIVLWFQLISAVLSLPGFVVAGPVLPRGAEWLTLAGVGIAGQCGQMLLTEGLRRVPAARATLANPLVVVFGALLGWLAFGEGLDWGDAAGTVLLVAGLLLAGTGLSQAVRSETSPASAD